MTEVHGGVSQSSDTFSREQVVLAQNRYGVLMNNNYVVPGVLFPLKVKGKGQVAADLQDAEARFAEMRRQAFQLRDEFGIRRYSGKQGEILLALHYWQKSASSKEISRLRWRWKVPSGVKKTREIGVASSFADVMKDSRNPQHKFVWQFFADIADTPPLFDLILQFEVARLDVNARLMAAAYCAKGLAQLFHGITHAEALREESHPLRLQLLKYSEDHGQNHLPGLS